MVPVWVDELGSNLEFGFSSGDGIGVKQLEQITRQPDRFTGWVEVENSLSRYAVPTSYSLPFFPSSFGQINVLENRRLKVTALHRSNI